VKGAITSSPHLVAQLGRILPHANVNVLSDVAVAASSAQAALESAVVNVEINRNAITDASERDPPLLGSSCRPES